MSNRQQYIDKIAAQLEEWDYDMDRLEHRVKDYQGEIKTKFEEKLKEVRNDISQVNHKVKEFVEASEDALEDLKDGLEIAKEGIRLGIASAQSEFVQDEEEEQA